jgi:hypothetical protein
MGSSRQSDFLKRLSTVGFGPREAIEVVLGSIVHDVREQAVHKRFKEDEMETVIRFHDDAEHLWRDSMATDPPIEPAELHSRCQRLLDEAIGPLGQFHSKLERCVRNAQELAEKHGG